jgi:hypothetical protein
MSIASVNVAEMKTLQYHLRQSLCKQLEELALSVWVFE